jgi:cysteine desulfurase family protein (TIGR01976 family)
VATWTALERFGARIVWWKVRDDGRLWVQDLEGLLSGRTRLVACTVTSNATGTCVDVAAVAKLAHDVGADVFLDAVHFGPHGPIDVQAFGCDYLVCSGYKIFAPHMGFAWCRTAAVQGLPTFREDFIPDAMPDKLEAGTFVYENVAGMEAVVQYFERLAGRVGTVAGVTRSAVLRSAMEAIAAYEQTLSAALLDAVESTVGAVVYGVTDRRQLGDRVPTVCFTVAGVPSSAIADGLAVRGVGVRSGHMYTPRLMRRLGLLPEGVVRVSLVHYNKMSEVTRFREVLADLIDVLRRNRGQTVEVPVASPRS